MRIAELDSLRGLAALAIVIFHLNPQAFSPGWTGVDLFFVLSGYLITGIILRHGGTKGFLKAFYIRRGLRIWPIYYLALFVLVAIILRMPKPLSLASLPYYLTYTQNVPLYWKNSAPTLAPFDHTWTLSLEEQFYLIWPALLLACGKKWVIPVCLATIAIAVMAREDGWLAWSHYSERTLLGRCDGFALGGLLAAILHKTKGRDSAAGSGLAEELIDGPSSARSRTLALAGGFGLAAILGLAYLAWDAVACGGLIYSLGLPTPRKPSTTILAVGIVYAGIVGLVAIGAGSRWLAPLRFPPLAYLGKISYGLYLYHYPLFWLIGGYTIVTVESPTMRAAKLAATLLAAVASWHLIEAPILRLKDRFGYRNS